MDTLIKYKKPLLIIAGVLIVIEVVWGVYTLTRPVSKTVSRQAQIPTVSSQPTSTPSMASIVLKGATSAKVGQNIPVDVEISSNVSTDGVDLILKYDPKLLEVVPSSDKAAVTTGKMYQDYPGNSFDPASGVITISGVSLNKAAAGAGNFGSINFKAKAAGSTKISVDFTPGSTIDSNVTESSSGKDILNKVTNLDVTIN